MEKIEIRSLFSGWKTVDREQAARFVSCLLRSMTAIPALDRPAYIEAHRLRGCTVGDLLPPPTAGETRPGDFAATLNEGQKIYVHIYNPNSSREIKTRNYNKPFTVRRESGRLGIDWNIERNPYTCGGSIFNPLCTFAPSVIFEDVETGARFHFDNLTETVRPID